MATDIQQQLDAILKQRILIWDGAMGTMIQGYNLTEEDYRGERFADHPCQLSGNSDILCLTRPDVIEEIHRAFLDAGADIIETNTFSAQAISQADYEVAELSYEINVAAAQVARRAADAFSQETPEKPRFVAGSIGPTNVSLSLSPDVDNPGFRTLTFDTLKDAYKEQARGLVDGGVDFLLPETTFDTLNLKACIVAIEELFDDIGRRLPVVLSLTITDRSGRTLSGQTLDAAWTSIAHAKPFAVGLNCALGASEMRPYVEELASIAPVYVSCYPNAGLPNEMGEYDLGCRRYETAAVGDEFAEQGWVNIVPAAAAAPRPEHIRRHCRGRPRSWRPTRVLPEVRTVHPATPASSR